MTHKGLLFADVHSVAVDIDSYIKEMEFLINQIETIEGLDYVISCGDYFDRKMYLNDGRAEQAVRYLQRIIETCIYKKIKLRIIYGTKSHEEDQYRVLYNYKSDYVRFIEKVESEKLFDDLFVLYLPEEFMTSKKEYYKEYLYNGVCYDYIFGHGIIRDVMAKAANHVESSTKFKKVPSFTYAELSDCCLGEVYFGHYHVRTNLHDKVFYIGSYDRFAFDDGDDGSEKGFYLAEMKNKKEKKYSHQFRINPFAKRFSTIVYKEDDPIFQNMDTMVDTIETIRKTIENDSSDKVRLIFQIPEDHENAELLIKTVQEMTSKNKRVKTSFLNNPIEKKRDEELKALAETDAQYSFLLDENLLVEVKIAMFADVVYGKKLSPEKVKELIDGNIMK